MRLISTGTTFSRMVMVLVRSGITHILLNHTIPKIVLDGYYFQQQKLVTLSMKYLKSRSSDTWNKNDKQLHRMALKYRMMGFRVIKS